MSGVSLRDGELVVERSPNELDELATAFSELLSQLNVEHVFIAGYVAVLTGRAGATDDIGVLIERLSEEGIDRIVGVLEANGDWGPAMPLDETYGNLSSGTNIWVAPDGRITPHLEVKFPSDESDRASLSNAIDAYVGEGTTPVGPLELRITYKLYLGGQKDLEDAARLYGLFRQSLRPDRLEPWVERLDVTDQYARLRSLCTGRETRAKRPGTARGGHALGGVHQAAAPGGVGPPAEPAGEHAAAVRPRDRALGGTRAAGAGARGRRVERSRRGRRPRGVRPTGRSRAADAELPHGRGGGPNSWGDSGPGRAVAGRDSARTPTTPITGRLVRRPAPSPA
jgi:hypothetical protein